jgi:multiple sugar transport system permease protein
LAAAAPDVRAGPALPRRTGSLARRQGRIAFWFLLPWAIGFCAFTLWPMLDSLILSFTSYNILGHPKFVGLLNYKYMLFGQGTLFWQSLKVTIYYVLGSVPLGTAIALFLAVLLNQKVWGEGLFRTLFYIPSVVTGVPLAVLWTWVYQPQFGLLNTFLSKVFHITNPPQWIYSPHTAMISLIIISFWNVGGAMLIYLAGLQGIQPELYEAARVDGAGTWALFRSITVPQLTPQILFNLVLGVIGSFQVFTTAYVITDGGPGYSTTVLVLYLYKAAFEDFQMGYASALAWAIFIIVAAITALIFRSFTNRVFYGGE